MKSEEPLFLFPEVLPPEDLPLRYIPKKRTSSNKRTALAVGDFVTLRCNKAVVGLILSLTTAGQKKSTTAKHSPHFHIKARVKFYHPHEDYLPERLTTHLLFLPFSDQEKLSFTLSKAREAYRAEVRKKAFQSSHRWTQSNRDANMKKKAKRRTPQENPSSQTPS